MRILSFSEGVAKRELKRFRQSGSVNHSVKINSNELSAYDSQCKEYIYYTSLIEESKLFQEIQDLQKEYKSRFIIFGVTNKYRESACVISSIMQEAELIKFKTKKDYTKLDKFKMQEIKYHKKDILGSLHLEQKKIARYIHLFKEIHREHLDLLIHRLDKVKNFILYFSKI